MEKKIDKILLGMQSWGKQGEIQRELTRMSGEINEMKLMMQNEDI